jgi:hypothetical protein
MLLGGGMREATPLTPCMPIPPPPHSPPPQVFHGIVPKLLKAPVGAAGLKALGQLAHTAGERRGLPVGL